MIGVIRSNGGDGIMLQGGGQQCPRRQESRRPGHTMGTSRVQLGPSTVIPAAGIRQGPGDQGFLKSGAR